MPEWFTDINPYEGTEWWDEASGAWVGPGASDVINFDPSGYADWYNEQNNYDDSMDGYLQADDSLEQWLDDTWMMSSDAAQGAASYMSLNPYDPTDEINSIREYHQNVGTMSNQMSDQLYKQFSEQQNLAASRGFASGGEGYLKDAARNTYENTWMTGQFTAQNQMDTDINAAQSEFMESWWEILMAQPDPFDFDTTIGSGSSGDSGYEGGGSEDFNEDDVDMVDDIDDGYDGDGGDDTDEEEEWFGNQDPNDPNNDPSNQSG